MIDAEKNDFLFGLLQGLKNGIELDTVIKDNKNLMETLDISIVEFLSFVSKNIPELKDKANTISLSYNKSIVNNINGFLQSMKENDPNKYFYCRCFMQNDRKGNMSPLKFPRGTLNYIASGTHRGKTTAMVSIALDALMQGHTVNFITTEELPNQIIMRFIKGIAAKLYNNVLKCSISGKLYYPNIDDIDGYIENCIKDFNTFDINDNPCNTLKDAIYKSLSIISNYLNNNKLVIVDHSIQKNFEELESTMLSLSDKSIFMVDYVQHIKSSVDYVNNTRQVIIQNISQRLASIASVKNSVVISGAQFNRSSNIKSSEEDKFKADFLDLTLFRECGDLEQDANLVIGIGQQLLNEPAISGVNVVRFYEILKQRGHAPDVNKYEILDNSEFSIYSANIKNDGKLKIFEPIPIDKKQVKKETVKQSTKSCTTWTYELNNDQDIPFSV